MPVVAEQHVVSGAEQGPGTGVVGCEIGIGEAIQIQIHGTQCAETIPPAS